MVRTNFNCTLATNQSSEEIQQTSADQNHLPSQPANSRLQNGQILEENSPRGESERNNGRSSTEEKLLQLQGSICKVTEEMTRPPENFRKPAESVSIQLSANTQKNSLSQTPKVPVTHNTQTIHNSDFGVNEKKAQLKVPSKLNGRVNPHLTFKAKSLSRSGISSNNNCKSTSTTKTNSNGMLMPSQQKSNQFDNSNQHVVRELELAGIPVLMVQKDGQIVYKLHGNMSVQSLEPHKREILLEKIKALHQNVVIPDNNPPGKTTAQQLTAPATAASIDQSKIGTSNTTTHRPSMIQQPVSSSTSLKQPSGIQLGINRVIVPQAAAQASKSEASIEVHSPPALNPNNHSQHSIPQPSSFSIPRTGIQTGSNRPIMPQSSPSQPVLSIPTATQVSKSQPSIEAHIPIALNANPAPQLPTSINLSIPRTVRPLVIPVSSPPPSNGPLNASEINSDTSKDFKITRKYTKTGKYSKKRPRQQMTPDDEGISDNQCGQSQISRTMELQEGPRIIAQPITHMQTTELYPRMNQPMTPEEDIGQRFLQAIARDQQAVLCPDYKTPFESFEDVTKRLLPYHIFQYPEEELRSNDTTSELEEMKAGLGVVKRRKVLIDKFNTLLKRGAEKNSTTPLTNLCNRLANESTRNEINDFRALKQQLETVLRNQQQPVSAKIQVPHLQHQLESSQIELVTSLHTSQVTSSSSQLSSENQIIN
ncbi:hypothetical protein G9A89_015448 [Geosiphon pyriformis]|nr:hypothetical protein G9A89_015448 [Geosiphon pyriformis]